MDTIEQKTVVESKDEQVVEEDTSYDDTSTYEDTDVNEYYERSQEMYNIEMEVWEVYSMLQEYVEDGSVNILSKMDLKDVYKLIYPRYDPPF